jgi:cytochrome c oxidase assembly protein subunit 15
MNSRYCQLYRRLLFAATLLAFAVIVLGAYVRQSDAGLGCPDWPGCYGQLVGVPTAAHEQAAALQAYPDKPVHTAKAWKEMTHRYLAGSLGLLIASIAGLALYQWKNATAGRPTPFSPTRPAPPLLPLALLALIVGQALLGMWTVTHLLKPIIVSAHLLGGMLTLSLLIVLLWQQYRPAAPLVSEPSLRRAATVALAAVLLQIALGGWVSSNYAALACPDFPTCQGHWLPEMDFAQGFQPQRPHGPTADGSLPSLAALTAIHWSHRLGALLVLLSVGWLVIGLRQAEQWRHWGNGLLTLLALQLALGIGNILLALPLALAVAHTAGAALLLVLTLVINLRQRLSHSGQA